MKEKIRKVWEKIKKFLSIKTNLITVVVALLIIIGIILFIVLNGRSKEKFALDHIYDIYPEEVRKIYSNYVDVSCSGDLHLDIAIDSGEVSIDKLDKKILLTYLFSNLDKENLLMDEMNDSLIRNTEKKLFAKDNNLEKEIKDFNYKEYTYNSIDGKIKRTKGECSSYTKSILHLYGYFWNKDILSIDINVAYLKEGKLYNYDNEKLGDYDGDTSKLSSLTEHTSYYRVNYVKDNGTLKLSSVEWKHRS